MAFEILRVFALLMFAHALADYPLQGDFLSRAKSRANPLPGVPWYQAMAAHVLIQAGFVWIITGSEFCAIGEAIIHWLADDAKCTGKISFNGDQAIHTACKFAWAMIAVVGFA